jgi:hypothetical protein
MSWRPIESAPKDGSVVLLWLKEWAGEINGVYPAKQADDAVAVGWWRDGSSDYPGADWWELAGGDAYATWGRPSHWQPLPAPPHAGTSSREGER